MQFAPGTVDFARMPTASKILFCHCQNAKVLPPEVKAAVYQRLKDSGLPFEETPDLCEMSARKDPRLHELANGGAVKVAACFPRAVKWLFAAGGASLSADAAQIFNMRSQSAAEVADGLLAAELTPNLPPDNPAAAVAQAPPSGRVEPAAAKPGEWKPWFPVIDYSRCTNCMQCLSFCLFGVYGVDARQTIQVQSPASCKTNCPACSRVCPEAAIVFPKYAAGPINGDEVKAADLEREKMKIDISALLGGDVYSLLRQRSERTKSRFSKERDADKALAERQKCLAQLMEGSNIPPEVLMALPGPEEIARRAAEAKARAQAALDQQTANKPPAPGG